MSGWLKVLFISLFSMWATACQKHSEPLTSGANSPFQFDPAQVIELSLVRFDPEASAPDTRWSATLRKQKTQWSIATQESQSLPLLDSVADDIFISHLIDSLRSVRIVSVAPLGSLESFSLDPPRVGIKWQTPTKAYEFRMGSRLKNGSGFYFTLDHTHVFVATGFAFSLLDSIHSVQFLRKKTWTTLSPDDIDEIELFHHGKLALYAQREGDRWTDRKHQSIRKNIDSLLNETINARPQQIIDDPTHAVRLRKLIQSRSLYETHLRDRFGSLTSFKISPYKNVLYGINTSRPEGVFVLDPSLLSVFRN